MPISSPFNQPRFAGLPIQALQVDRLWRPFPNSGFAGRKDNSSGRILAFPKLPSQEVSTTARAPGLHAKLLPFVTQARPSDTRHRVYVYMSLQFNRGRWQLQFLEKDLQTTLPRSVSLATAEAVIYSVGGPW